MAGWSVLSRGKPFRTSERNAFSNKPSVHARKSPFCCDSNVRHSGGTTIPHLNFSLPCAALRPVFEFAGILIHDMSFSFIVSKIGCHRTCEMWNETKPTLFHLAGLDCYSQRSLIDDISWMAWTSLIQSSLPSGHWCLRRHLVPDHSFLMRIWRPRRGKDLALRDFLLRDVEKAPCQMTWSLLSEGKSPVTCHRVSYDVTVCRLVLGDIIFGARFISAYMVSHCNHFNIILWSPKQIILLKSLLHFLRADGKLLLCWNHVHALETFVKWILDVPHPWKIFHFYGWILR